MVYYKTNDEIELIRKSCLLVSATLAEVANFLKPGVTTLQADILAEKFIRDNGAIPSFKNYKGFPFTCCISVNDAVVHGFPNNEALKEGDIVSVDVGVFMNGYHGDSAYTFALAALADDAKQLLRVTKESLYKGVEKAIAGNRVGDISYAVQEHTERKYGYGVVRELVGHGLGKQLHEDPQVPNYGKGGTGLKMKEGLVIAIEPMINMGKKEVYYEEDGWTVKTKDGKPAAHYEHTVCVQKNKPHILSSFAEIEANERANPYLDASYY
ncbi:type I methionyl aminopeptidase [Agriterribacter sp.]|uniref:type I methionyl aminopeptidase n=1 Tax=Agriterribacter sp. TaxID=2821509 RepID=UPI002BD311F1|nr:type I methionyl aminopeptidase [Agriterribacter sp.]HRO47055.1 type I methionyl aminopeptidase [Agriterribacter sp.]HRQ19021.1 type I methionyl aminopeptidase [Agriterribacter sp.]